MKLKTTIIATLSFLLMVSSSVLYAKGGQGFGLPMGDRMFEHLADELALTDEQADTIQGILGDLRHDTKDLREAMKANKNEMESLIHSEVLDEEGVASLAAEQASLVAQQMELAAHARFAVWNTLDSEQQQQAEAMKSNFRERREGRKGRFGQRKGLRRRAAEE